LFDLLRNSIYIQEREEKKEKRKKEKIANLFHLLDYFALNRIFSLLSEFRLCKSYYEIEKLIPSLKE